MTDLMASGTWLVVVAVVLAATASLVTPLDLDDSYESQDEEQMQALHNMETYLQHLKNELQQRKETADSYEANMAELEDQDVDHMTYKRFNPSGFSAVRGKRNDLLDYSDYDLPSRQNDIMKDKLLDMVNYFQYIHNRNV